MGQSGPVPTRPESLSALLNTRRARTARTRQRRPTAIRWGGAAVLAVHASLPPIHESAIHDLFGLARSARPDIPLNRKVGWARVDQCQRGPNRKRLTQHAAGVHANPPRAAHRNPVGRRRRVGGARLIAPNHNRHSPPVRVGPALAPPLHCLNRKVGWARVDQQPTRPESLTRVAQHAAGRQTANPASSRPTAVPA